MFSNGVIVLGVLSSLMIFIFDADLNALIHLYVVGVFTSFTLSQTGMVKHWIAEGRKGAEAMSGWRRSIVINIIGAVVTGLVLVVVIGSKFGKARGSRSSSWPCSCRSSTRSITTIPNVRRQLDAGKVRPGAAGRNHVVLLVRDFDVATAGVPRLPAFVPS